MDIDEVANAADAPFVGSAKMWELMCDNSWRTNMGRFPISNANILEAKRRWASRLRCSAERPYHKASLKMQARGMRRKLQKEANSPHNSPRIYRGRLSTAFAHNVRSEKHEVPTTCWQKRSCTRCWPRAHPPCSKSATTRPRRGHQVGRNFRLLLSIFPDPWSGLRASAGCG